MINLKVYLACKSLPVYLIYDCAYISAIIILYTYLAICMYVDDRILVDSFALEFDYLLGVFRTIENFLLTI